MKKKIQRESAEAVRGLAALLLQKTDPSLLGLGAEKLSEFMQHVGSSAPRETGSAGERWQDDIIAGTVAKGSAVLDLGCGEGQLLARLVKEKRIRGQGVELDAEAVFACAERGVPVFQADLDLGLQGFADRSFDYVILEETLQTLHRPVEILKEMLRVGRKGIVSFPNFGYWRVRLDLATRGRMPVSERLPHRWYDTPNIHLFTLQDFLDLAAREKIAVVSGSALCEGAVRELSADDNLHAEEVLLVLEKK